LAVGNAGRQRFVGVDAARRSTFVETLRADAPPNVADLLAAGDLSVSRNLSINSTSERASKTMNFGRSGCLSRASEMMC
jgi:hypothetical protein